MPQFVQPNSKIRWRYKLLLADGSLFEEHTDEQGDLLQLGDDAIHPNLEKLLTGLEVGENVRFLVMAEEAFGLPDPAAIQELPLDQFDSQQPPKPKQIISFTLPSGEEIPGHILDVNDNTVRVDFNHPLAGHNITLEVEIIEVFN